jgi:hypothetical protein
MVAYKPELVWTLSVATPRPPTEKVVYLTCADGHVHRYVVLSY